MFPQTGPPVLPDHAEDPDDVRPLRCGAHAGVPAVESLRRGGAEDVVAGLAETDPRRASISIHTADGRAGRIPVHGWSLSGRQWHLQVVVQHREHLGAPADAVQGVDDAEGVCRGHVHGDQIGVATFDRVLVFQGADVIGRQPAHWRPRHRRHIGLMSPRMSPAGFRRI